MSMQNYNEISNMFSNGITLSSGVVLTSKDLFEIDRLIDIYKGICSYEFVSEGWDEDEFEKYPKSNEFPVECFHEITESLRDIPTGEDEIWAVMDAIKTYSYRQKKGEAND